MNERDTKFFRPLWIRVLVTAVVAAWLVAEVVLSHDELWIAITAAGVVYCVWNFFLRFPKAAPSTATETPPSDPPKQA